MIIIKHRVNTIESLKKTSKEFGVEIDLRSNNKEIYLNDLDNNHGIAGAITFYGRRIRQGENYDSSEILRQKIADEKARSGEARKNAPKQPWRRPKYGMWTRIDPETGDKAKFSSKNTIIESYKSKNISNGKV